MRPLCSVNGVGSLTASLAVAALLCLGLLLTGCASGMEGSWTLEKGAINFDRSANSYGDTWNPHAQPGGGLIVTKNGDKHAVTLVSADGKRFQADKAVMQGGLLRVEVGGNAVFCLSQTSPNRLEWLVVDMNGKPTKGPPIALVPGTPTSTSTGSATPAPSSP
jgi:hypothetical protein